MRYIENKVPEDFAKICFVDMDLPLCELTEDEYKEKVYGIQSRRARILAAAAKIAAKQFGGHANDSLETLKLSKRAYNALTNAGIKTVRDLCRMTEQEILGLKSMGITSLEDVKENLKKLGLKLKSSKVAKGLNN